MQRARHAIGAVLAFSALVANTSAQDPANAPKPVKQGDILHQLDLGWMAAAAGDVDGDGCADLIVSSCDLNGFNGRIIEPFPETAVRIVSGRDGAVLREWVGEDHGFGHGIVAIPDLDGDGILDVAIGQGEPSGRVLETVVYSSGSGAPLRTLPGLPLVTGDVDDDGVPDLVYFERFFEGAWSERLQCGRLWFESTAKATTLWEMSYRGEASTSLAMIGDLDQDGRSDLVLTLQRVRDGAILPATTRAVSTATNRTLRESVLLKSGNAYWLPVCALGDLDGDGIEEYAVGNNADDSSLNEGGVVVVHDGRTGKERYRIGPADVWGESEPLEGARFGSTIVSLGDFDGDGGPDFAVGTGFNQGDYYGYVGVFSAKDGRKILVRRGQTFDVLGLPEYFAASVVAVGDVNGDGYADLAVGEDLDEGWDPEAKDRVFVIAGGPTPAGEETTGR